MVYQSKNARNLLEPSRRIDTIYKLSHCLNLNLALCSNMPCGKYKMMIGKKRKEESMFGKSNGSSQNLKLFEQLSVGNFLIKNKLDEIKKCYTYIWLELESLVLLDLKFILKYRFSWFPPIFMLQNGILFLILFLIKLYVILDSWWILRNFNFYFLKIRYVRFS